MKRALRQVLKPLAGTVIGLLLLEVVFRLVIPPPIDLLRLNRRVESERGKFARYDSLLGWDGLENADADFQWIDTRHHVHQNRFGYRGTAYDLPRNDKRRLLVLGDSYVWGFGVEDGEIFTSLMEQKTGSVIEVVNVGVSGYGNDQEYLQWREKARLWEPDDVVLVITPYTDIVDNLFPNRYGYPKPCFIPTETGELQLTNVPVPRTSEFSNEETTGVDIEALGSLAGLLSRSYLARMLVNAGSRYKGIRKALESHDLIPRRLPGYDWEYPLYLSTPSQQTREAWRIMFGILDLFDREVRGAGHQFTVVIVPSIIQVYPELWEQFRAGHAAPHTGTLDREMPNKVIRSWCRDRHVPVIDLLPEFAAAGRTNAYLYYPYNRHWTPAGHALVADALLRGMGIVSRP
jgi:lysophospholipase L1-like esterase